MLIFLKKNIIFFIIFIIVLITFLFSWKYFFKVTEKNLEPSTYEKMIEAIEMNKPEKLKKAEIFIIENNNIYGALTAMFLSKKYILQNDLDKAFVQLENSLKYTKEENLKNILKLRMIKIKIQKQQYDHALDILKSIDNHNWKNMTEEIQGDIFLKKNNQTLAIKSWKNSLSLQNSNASKEIIKMKINEFK